MAGYQRLAPKLDAAIAEAKSLSPAPGVIKAPAQADIANGKLVAMETRAFALVRAGDLRSAIEATREDLAQAIR